MVAPSPHTSPSPHRCGGRPFPRSHRDNKGRLGLSGPSSPPTTSTAEGLNCFAKRDIWKRKENHITVKKERFLRKKKNRNNSCQVALQLFTLSIPVLSDLLAAWNQRLLAAWSDLMWKRTKIIFSSSVHKVAPLKRSVMHEASFWLLGSWMQVWLHWPIRNNGKEMSLPKVKEAELQPGVPSGLCCQSVRSKAKNWCLFPTFHWPRSHQRLFLPRLIGNNWKFSTNVSTCGQREFSPSPRSIVLSARFDRQPMKCSWCLMSLPGFQTPENSLQIWREYFASVELNWKENSVWH